MWLHQKMKTLQTLQTGLSLTLLSLSLSLSLSHARTHARTHAHTHTLMHTLRRSLVASTRGWWSRCCTNATCSSLTSSAFKVLAMLKFSNSQISRSTLPGAFIWYVRVVRDWLSFICISSRTSSEFKPTRYTFWKALKVATLYSKRSRALTFANGGVVKMQLAANFSKVFTTVILYSKHSRALTFANGDAFHNVSVFFFFEWWRLPQRC